VLIQQEKEGTDAAYNTLFVDKNDLIGKL